MQKAKKEKIYCYADETGQDTLGQFFIVVAIVLGREQFILDNFLQECERNSGKGIKKWTNTPDRAKLIYISQATSSRELLRSPVCFARFGPGLDYDYRTFETIREALNIFAAERQLANFYATVLVDGLNFAQQRRMKKAFIQSGVSTTVREIRDESSSIIRFVDAVAGLVRDADKGGIYSRLVKQKVKRGFFRELKVD